MAKRTVEESSLTSVADAIRERAGTSEPLVFPEGFKSAVKGIPDTLALLCSDLIKEYSNENATYLKNYTFREARSLERVYLPNVVGSGYQWFPVCENLETVIMPKVDSLGEKCFVQCLKLKKLDFHRLSAIEIDNFRKSALETLILRKSDACCQLRGSNNLLETPIANGTGYIYVPKALVDSYKSATNWSAYASQIRAIEDYPEITGGAV
jgi:hypothetical protein